MSLKYFGLERHPSFLALLTFMDLTWGLHSTEPQFIPDLGGKCLIEESKSGRSRAEACCFPTHSVVTSSNFSSYYLPCTFWAPVGTGYISKSKASFCIPAFFSVALQFHLKQSYVCVCACMYVFVCITGVKMVSIIENIWLNKYK